MTGASKPPPSSEPLLIHDRSLTGKVGAGSEARDIVDQQLHQLGTQLVTQLNVLLRNVRSHGGGNLALDRPVAAIRTLVKTLGDDKPVALRVFEGFVFLGERHLRTTTQQLAIFASFIDALAELHIGEIAISAQAGEAEVRKFAELFAAAEPGPGALEALQAQLAIAGVSNITLEPPRHARKADRPAEAASRSETRQGGGRAQPGAGVQAARSAYARASTALGGVNQASRSNGTIHFRQAKRAIQNIVDALLKDPATVLGLTTLRSHDEYTQNHSVNVALLAMALGNRVGYSKVDLADLGLSALFHDLGKCAVPLEVLNKPGAFTPEEWTVMRTHPSEGVLALLSSRGLDKVPARMAAAAFEHHFTFDGKGGYPALSAPWRPTLSSRIIAVADCYDAMTSARVYRRDPLSPPNVLEFMLTRAGTSFDPALVKTFVTCIGIIPIGTLVLLDSGELAVVLRPAAEKEHAERPIVRVIAGAEGTPLDPPVERDLRAQTAEGAYAFSIVRLVDNTEYHLDTSRYVTP